MTRVQTATAPVQPPLARPALHAATMALGISVSALFAWLATRHVDWGRLVAGLTAVRPVPLAAGFVLSILALVAMAYRWRFLLGGACAVRVTDAFDFTAIGFFSGLFIPQRLGDLVKVLLLARRCDTSRTTVMGSVVVERLADVIMLLGLAAVFAAVVRLPLLLQTGIVVTAAATLAMLALLWFGGPVANTALTIAERWVPRTAVALVERVAVKFAAGIESIRDPRQFAKALAFTGLVWFVSAASMSAYIVAFGLHVPWYAGFLVIVLTNLGGILPSSPGSIGVYDYMTVVALSTWGVDRTSALTFAIVSHALSLLMIALTGAFGLARQGVSVRSVREQSGAAGAGEGGSRRSWPIARAVAVLGGLVVLVAANYFLRHTLERSDAYIYSFIQYFYPAAEKQIFGPGFPRWKWLLPIPQLSGTWTTTTLIATHLVELRLGPPATWCLFNALLTVVSFITSWAVFRSAAFSFTFALCMGFGTQLYSTYAVTGGMGLCLLLMYYEVALLCAVRVITPARNQILWRAAWLGALLITALAYESWLDFAVFGWLGITFAAIVAARAGKREWRSGLVFTMASLTATVLVYVYVKTHAGYGQVPGAESDVVFNYPVLAPKLEDVLSNVLTQFYIAITNFLPPVFVSSTSFYELGGDRLIDLQHGYHAPFSYLVPMQYMFLWRYYAGAAIVMFGYLLFRVIRRNLAAWSPDAFAVGCCMLMILTGGPTHAFVKARPMNSMPVLGYHVLVGVMGAAGLLSCVASIAIRRFHKAATGRVVVAGIWLMIAYGALARPAMLNHEAAQVGLGEATYPNPMASLASMIGVAYTQPGGIPVYRLTRYVPPASTPAGQRSSAPTPDHNGLSPPLAPAVLAGELSPLPLVAPDLAKWNVLPGVKVSQVGGSAWVEGNSTASGYQLVSPAIPVPRRHRVLVRVSGVVERGRVCLGVLDTTQQHWLVAPAASQPNSGIDTASNVRIWLVLANCANAETSAQTTRFRVDSISYGVLMNATDAVAAR